MVVDLLVPQFHMLKYDVFYKSKPRNIFGLQDVCMQFAGHLQAQTFFRLIDFNQKYHARVQQNSLTHQKLFRLKLLISFCIIKARYFCLFGTAVCSQFHHAQAHCKHRSCTIMLASFYNKRSYKSNGSPSFLFKSEFLSKRMFSRGPSNQKEFSLISTKDNGKIYLLMEGRFVAS